MRARVSRRARRDAPATGGAKAYISLSEGIFDLPSAIRPSLRWRLSARIFGMVPGLELGRAHGAFDEAAGLRGFWGAGSGLPARVELWGSSAPLAAAAAVAPLTAPFCTSRKTVKQACVGQIGAARDAGMMIACRHRVHSACSRKHTRTHTYTHTLSRCKCAIGPFKSLQRLAPAAALRRRPFQAASTAPLHYHSPAAWGPSSPPATWRLTLQRRRHPSRSGPGRGRHQPLLQHGPLARP